MLKNSLLSLKNKQLNLDEFLSRLDIEQLKLDLKLGDWGNSTEYDEDVPLLTIVNMKNNGSVMNIALPENNNNDNENKIITWNKSKNHEPSSFNNTI